MTGIARAASWSVMPALRSRAGQISSSNRSTYCCSLVAVISCITADQLGGLAERRRRGRVGGVGGAGRARSSAYAFFARARHSVASGSLKPRSARLAAASAPMPE